MANIDYSTEGAVGRGVAEGIGKITEKQKKDQLINLQHQWDVEAFNRAKAWEIEKLEIRSKLDFEREERRRQQLIDEGNALNKKLDSMLESGELEESNPFYQTKKIEAELKSSGFRTGETPLSLVSRQQPRPVTEKSPSRTDVSAAIKFLTEYNKKKSKASKFYYPLAPEPTAEEEATSEYYKDILQRAGVNINTGKPSGAPVPSGTISSGLPEPKTRDEYNQLPTGSKYIDSKGNIRTKS